MTQGHFGLDRAGWTRLGVVFCFGLVHGLGFAGALGIDSAWSWTLLGSLLVFNVGIETVQLALIALVFPVLTLLRHRSPTVGLWATGAISREWRRWGSCGSCNGCSASESRKSAGLLAVQLVP